MPILKKIAFAILILVAILFFVGLSSPMRYIKAYSFADFLSTRLLNVDTTRQEIRDVDNVIEQIADKLEDDYNINIYTPIVDIIETSEAVSNISVTEDINVASRYYTHLLDFKIEDLKIQIEFLYVAKLKSRDLFDRAIDYAAEGLISILPIRKPKMIFINYVFINGRQFHGDPAVLLGAIYKIPKNIAVEIANMFTSRIGR